jgi:hypothetical protein
MLTKKKDIRTQINIMGKEKTLLPTLLKLKGLQNSTLKNFMPIN